MKSLSPSVLFITTHSEQVHFQDPGKKLTFFPKKKGDLSLLSN